MTSIANGDWLAFNNVNFSAGSSAGRGDTRGWQSWQTVPANIAAVTGVSGVHSVYITFTSGQPATFVNLNLSTLDADQRAAPAALPRRRRV